MKRRYIFTKDYFACPTGYAQTTCKPEQKKLFDKDNVVWGRKYRNSVSVNPETEETIQGWALSVNKDGEQWDIPLPPLGNSPVIPKPIFNIGNVMIFILIVAIIFFILKSTKLIK